MKCRDVERWMAAGNGGDEDEAVRVHLDACPRCASIAGELSGLRGALAGRALSEPPAALFEKTRRLCLGRLEAMEKAGTMGTETARPSARPNGALGRIPPAVWAATVGLLLLTGFLFAPFFGDVLRSEPLSYASWVGLGFIVQNVFMLFFSPLLLRRKRRAEACA